VAGYDGVDPQRVKRKGESDNMKRYRIRALLLSPLVIRRERQSARSEGATSISGSLVRGAFAWAYLRRYAMDEVFRKIFLDEQNCRFGPLDPAERILPLTAYSCKREPGFRGDNRHGVQDLLVAYARQRLSVGRSPLLLTCPRCHQELKLFTGFCEKKNNKNKNEFIQADNRWRKDVKIHIGTDRTTHTAAGGIFYTLSTVEPVIARRNGQAPPAYEEPALVGWLEATDDAAKRLNELLAQEKYELRFGHARARGYGLVRLQLEEFQEERKPAAPSQLENWSRRLLALIAHEHLDPEHHFLFSISLPTGAILLDKALRYTLDLAEMVPWLPLLPPPELPQRGSNFLDWPGCAFANGHLWCVTAVTQHERLRGWNAAHGLPKADEWLVSRGAVYLYLFEGDAASRQQLYKYLQQLQIEGVGARRNEGFGYVVLDDDFHLDFAQGERNS
jgi:CRISPR-associated Csx10 family RAMP protein